MTVILRRRSFAGRLRRCPGVIQGHYQVFRAHDVGRVRSLTTAFRLLTVIFS